jgi:hypothetical protein
VGEELDGLAFKPTIIDINDPVFDLLKRDYPEDTINTVSSSGNTWPLGKGRSQPLDFVI